MLNLRKSEDRGRANFGWLDSQHSFSFGSYVDPMHTGFGPLLVINEDKVEPGRGFGTHGHRDMEIISYVLDGELAHKDSMGNGSVLRYGDVQRMSAGTGVTHSEFNHSASAKVHFLQIWIEPSIKGIAPGYEEKFFTPESKRGNLRLIASPEGSEGSVKIHQDAYIYAALLDGSEDLSHTFGDGRRTYVHLIRGQINVNGITLHAGDAIKLEAEPKLHIDQTSDAELLVFDLP
jgi:redox-sensitive bicupin YhaK (pirin superfamily)